MKIIEWIVDKLERRKSVSELFKAEDLVLSNATYEELQNAVRKLGSITLDDSKQKKEYILEVVTKYEEGYGSHWYGWSRNLVLTYDEAVELKERIKDKYYDVEIVKINNTK